MALHILLGKVSGGLPIYDAIGFASQQITTTQTSTASVAGQTAMRLTAKDVAEYFAVSTGTPDATTNPRGYLPAGGSIDLMIPVGAKVHCIDA